MSEPRNAAERQLRAQQAREGIEVKPHATVITGQGIALFRLLAMIHGLRLEAMGITVRRGTTCYAIAKKEFGFKGNKEKVLAQLEAYRRENYPDRVEAQADAQTN